MAYKACRNGNEYISKQIQGRLGSSGIEMSQQELDGLKRTDKGWDEDSTILQQPRLGESVELIANLKQF